MFKFKKIYFLSIPLLILPIIINSSCSIVDPKNFVSIIKKIKTNIETINKPSYNSVDDYYSEWKKNTEFNLYYNFWSIICTNATTTNYPWMPTTSILELYNNKKVSINADAINLNYSFDDINHSITFSCEYIIAILFNENCSPYNKSDIMQVIFSFNDCVMNFSINQNNFDDKLTIPASAKSIHLAIVSLNSDAKSIPDYIAEIDSTSTNECGSINALGAIKA